MIKIGKKYKEWTVLRISDHKAKNGTALYVCRCSCNETEQDLSKWHLEQKNRSFACPNCSQQKKKMSVDSYRGFEGKVFGKWTVIKKLPKVKLNSGRFETHFECICECGTQRDIRGAELKRGKSTQCIKCATRDNSFYCELCGCISHRVIDMEKECELLGLCSKCDKFCCFNCNIDPAYHLTD